MFARPQPGLVLIDSPYEPYTEYLTWNLSVSESSVCWGLLKGLGFLVSIRMLVSVQESPSAQ